LHPESSVTLIYGSGGVHQDSAIGYVYDPQTFVVTAQTSYGEVQGALDGNFTDSGNDRVVTVRSYVANPLLSSLAAVETVTDQAGNKLAETKNYFDNLGALQATAGNLTRQEKWIAGSVYAATQKSYNNLGLVLTETDPRGFITTYAYDSYKMYPASSTNALNQVTQFVYAYAVGKPQQITQPNGAVMFMLYDSLGRLTQEKIPDPVTGIQVIKSLISYSEASGNVSTTLIEYYDGSISRQTTGYFDGLGRQVQIRQQR
jgi:YD repeat-containing protein